ncbi:MAG: hypothetical protein ABIY55_24100 [Kofleriaceae bacterium]
MTRVWLVILFGAATAMSCNSPDIVPPTQLNLDRPVDIAFACYGPVNIAATGQTPNIVPTAQPPRWCNEYSPVLTPTTAPALPSGFTDPTLPPAYFWYGFILQPASGTVALSKFAAKASQAFISGASVNGGTDVQVVDADPGTPGKNAISVGENPVAIGTDVSGCHEVIANAGSCDLSVLDINSAVSFNAVIDQSEAEDPRSAIINRLSVRNGAMSPIAIRAKPAAMVVQPSDPGVEVTTSCPIGDSALTAPATGLAYIAYPGCNLVAGVDLASGAIQQGIQFTGTVPKILSPADLAILTCVDECSGGKPADSISIRPVALDLKVDTRGGSRRLAIGADNSAVVTVVDLDVAFLPVAAAPLQITLDTTAAPKLGVTALALTPQIAMGNSRSGRRRNNNVDVPANPRILGDSAVPADAIDASIGRDGQYVYAVATDGTVHVADVLNVKRECDTQVDMRFVRAIAATPANVPRLQCFPVGDATNPPRRPGAKGPGIELPVDGAPTSVAIIRGLDQPFTHDLPVQDDPACVPTTAAPCATTQVPFDNDPEPGMLIGYFAVITAASGQSFIANVDDDDGPDAFDPAQPQVTAPVLLMAHQLRDGFSLRGASVDPTVNQCTASDPPSTATGGPRSSGQPAVTVTVNTLGGAGKGFELPRLLKEACTFTSTPPATDPPTAATVFNGTVSELQIGASLARRDEVYPDLRSTVTQPWMMSWEGSLSNDNILTFVDGLQIRNGQMRIDERGLHLIDDSRPFCDAGVEPFDIVQLRGCNPANGANECPAGYTCFAHESNPVSGLGACMLTSEASRLSVACKDFLTSARRYTVGQAASGELRLLPRKHVLATTPIDGCIDDTQCGTLASYALALRSTASPLQLTPQAQLTDPHTWKCVLDRDRAPVNDDPAAKRCVEFCATTDDCDAGTICVRPDATAPDPLVRDGMCMESVLPSQSCVNGPQRFDLRAGEAFTLIGLRSGYVHSVTESGTGADPHACVKQPVAGSIDVSRIPLHAKPCDPLADKITGAIGDPAAHIFEPNPCSTTVDQVDDAPNYLPAIPGDASSQCVADENTPTVPVFRSGVPAIKVRTRNATLTLVEPYSPGDLTCIGDRLGDQRLGGAYKIPQLLPVPFDAANWFGATYQLGFDQKAGYVPLALSAVQVVPSQPIKIVRGPSESMWIMDDGDILAVSVSQSSTKGQVYRVEMQNLNTVNLLQ